MADDAQAEGQGTKGSRKKLVIIIVLAAVLLSSGGGAAAFFLQGGDEEQTAEAAGSMRQEAIYTKVRTLEGKPMFVVTLQSTDDIRHYMQAYVEAKSRDQEVADALNLHMPLIVARLNTLFSTQIFEHLMTIEGKQELRTQATDLVRSIMRDNIGRSGVESILFTNLVMQ